MNIVLDYPAWIYAVCILVGIVFSFLLYYKEKKYSPPSWLVKVLAVFRFCLTFLLTYLLFNPQLFSKREMEEKPIVAFLVDNSESIIFSKDSSEIKQQFLSKLKDLKSSLNDKFQVENFAFGEQLSSIDTLTFSEKETNISSALSAVSDRFYNQNLSAVILISDGIYNEGNNPIYEMNLPSSKIFTIALGDTTVKKDLAITNVEHNKMAFLGNKFPIRVNFKSNFYKGKSHELSIWSDGKLLDSRKITSDKNEFSSEQSFLINADNVGIKKYLVKLKHEVGEHTYENNSYDFYVEVLNSKQNILLLANAPHPDIAAIKSALMKNENYNADVFYSYNFKSSSKQYDAIVLHNLPSLNNSNFQNIFQNKTPKFWIVGTQTNLNSLQNFGIQIPSSNSFSEASPTFNSGFSLFEINSTVNTSKLPPLNVPFATKYGLNTQHVLFYQTIGNTKTNYPLMGFYESNSSKTAYLLGEGIWRWKLAEFQANNNTNFFDALIQKTFQYLTVKEDKSRFKILLQKNTFNDNEEIIVNAEVYNKAYELVNSSEVSLELSNDKNEKFKYQFSKTNNRYSLNLGKLPEGNYSFVSKTNFDGETMIKSGAFAVSKVRKEVLQTQANHYVLNQLSLNSDGRMYYKDQLDELEKELLNADNFPSVLRFEEATEPLLNLWWILFLIILLASSEWFLRKYFGGY
ncbi:MAG: hypothetical protein ACLGGV_06255 [Bacteroidia bacterium]